MCNLFENNPCENILSIQSYYYWMNYLTASSADFSFGSTKFGKYCLE